MNFREVVSDSNSKDDDFEKPEEPLDDDCCHNGCTLCVFDIYQKELEKWSERCSRPKSKQARRYDLLSKTRFNAFRLIREKVLGVRIKKLEFEACPTDNTIRGVLPYEPGEHLVLRYYYDDAKGVPDLPGSQRTLSRAYSLIWDPQLSTTCRFEIVVKSYENGTASVYLHNMKIGDIAYWRGPYGGFPYIQNAYKHILGLCMGTGVVPIYSISRKIVSDEDDFSQVKLLFGIRQPDEIILREELCELASYWNFKFIYYMTGNRNHTFVKRHCETLKSGRITTEALAQEFGAANLKEYLVLICGSEEFSENMLQNIKQFNVPDTNIHVF